MEPWGVCGASFVGRRRGGMVWGGRVLGVRGHVGGKGSKTSMISPVYGQVHLRLIRGPERIETTCGFSLWQGLSDLRLIRGPERIETKAKQSRRISRR